MSLVNNSGYFAGNGDFVGCGPATAERADCERFGIEPSVDATEHGFARLRDGGVLDLQEKPEIHVAGMVFEARECMGARTCILRDLGDDWWTSTSGTNWHVWKAIRGKELRFVGLDARHARPGDVGRLCCMAEDYNDSLIPGEKMCTLAIGDHDTHEDIATGRTWPAQPAPSATPSAAAQDSPPTEAEVCAALDVCARALAHEPNTIRAIRQFLDRLAATSVEQLVDSYKSGIYGEEAHTLRNIVLEAGDTGLPMPDSPALRSLVNRGLVTAYMPTLLGAAVDRLVYDTQDIPVLGNMPRGKDENAESRPSGTKVRIGGVTRDVGPMTKETLAAVAKTSAKWSQAQRNSYAFPETYEGTLPDGRVALLIVANHSLQSIDVGPVHFPDDPPEQASIKSMGLFLSERGVSYFGGHTKTGAISDVMSCQASKRGGDAQAETSLDGADPMPQGIGADDLPGRLSDFARASFSNPYFCKWATDNLAPEVTWPMVRAIVWGLFGADFGEVPDWEVLTAEYDAAMGYPHPPEPPPLGIDDYAAFVPDGCDERRWRHVIAVIMAYDAETYTGDRPSDDYRICWSVGDHVSHARDVLREYVKIRRQGYSPQIAIGRLPKEALGEMRLRPRIAAWYCEAYEAAR